MLTNHIDSIWRFVICFNSRYYSIATNVHWLYLSPNHIFRNSAVCAIFYVYVCDWKSKFGYKQRNEWTNRRNADHSLDRLPVQMCLSGHCTRTKVANTRSAIWQRFFGSFCFPSCLPVAIFVVKYTHQSCCVENILINYVKTTHKSFKCMHKHTRLHQ